MAPAFVFRQALLPRCARQVQVLRRAAGEASKPGNTVTKLPDIVGRCADGSR